MTQSKSRRKTRRLTADAKTTVVAMSVAALIGGWNLVGQVESKALQAELTGADAIAMMTPHPINIASTVTAWPTLKPLDTPAPIPTLVPLSSVLSEPNAGSNEPSQAPSTGVESAIQPLQVSAIPTLAPLPTMAPLPPMPSMPAPPPPPPAQNGGGQTSSGGS